jgi:hypothetical protein
VGYREQLEAGHGAFAALVRAWHERNGWSHRVLPSLAERLDLGRLHSSQLSNLRNRKLASPGPEVFLALGGCNRWLAAAQAGQQLSPPAAAALAADPELLAALNQSAVALVGPEGSVLGAGELLEIFVGLRAVPPGFDLRISEQEAPVLSAALAELLAAGRPWRQCRDTVMAAYGVEKRQRRERFAAVMAGLRDYSAAELDAELPDLQRTLVAVGLSPAGLPSADQLLEQLRKAA